MNFRYFLDFFMIYPPPAFYPFIMFLLWIFFRKVKMATLKTMLCVIFSCCDNTRSLVSNHVFCPFWAHLSPVTLVPLQTTAFDGRKKGLKHKLNYISYHSIPFRTLSDQIDFTTRVKTRVRFQVRGHWHNEKTIFIYIIARLWPFMATIAQQYHKMYSKVQVGLLFVKFNHHLVGKPSCYVVPPGSKWRLLRAKISAEGRFWVLCLQKRPFIRKVYLMTMCFWLIFFKVCCGRFQKCMTLVDVVVGEFSRAADVTIEYSEI